MQDRSMTGTDFDALLSWLDPDRENAATAYQRIRYRLMRIFMARGCTEAEDLADETINRVAVNLGHLRNAYKGDPALYFYAVAKKVLIEYTRGTEKKIEESELAEPAGNLECLEKCLESLTPANRDLIVEYYRKEIHDKLDARQRLAQQLGIPGNALRIRAHRIRQSLRECVVQCLRKERTEP